MAGRAFLAAVAFSIGIPALAQQPVYPNYPPPPPASGENAPHTAPPDQADQQDYPEQSAPIQQPPAQQDQQQQTNQAPQKPSPYPQGSEQGGNEGSNQSGQPSGSTADLPSATDVSAAECPGLSVIGQFSQLGSAGHGGTWAHGGLPHRFHLRPLDAATGERPLGGPERSCAGRRNQPARRHLRAQLSLRSAGHVRRPAARCRPAPIHGDGLGASGHGTLRRDWAARPICGSASTTCARPGRSCSSRARPI